MSKTGTDQLQSLFKSDIFMNMNAVGIDVSKRKSTVAILRPGGKTVGKPFDLPHLSARTAARNGWTSLTLTGMLIVFVNCP